MTEMLSRFTLEYNMNKMNLGVYYVVPLWSV